MDFGGHLPRRFQLPLVLLFAPATVFAASLVQKNPPARPADADSPVLIWDINLKLTDSLPRNFRTTDDPLKAGKGQLPANTGLADLHASGSGEFTREGFKLLLERTRGLVTVFDLRQETHIFVNELPVSWYATNDWANVGRIKSEGRKKETHFVFAQQIGNNYIGHPQRIGEWFTSVLLATQTFARLAAKKF